MDCGLAGLRQSIEQTVIRDVLFSIRTCLVSQWCKRQLHNTKMRYFVRRRHSSERSLHAGLRPLPWVSRR